MTIQDKDYLEHMISHDDIYDCECVNVVVRPNGEWSFLFDIDTPKDIFAIPLMRLRETYKWYMKNLEISSYTSVHSVIANLEHHVAVFYTEKEANEYDYSRS